MTGQAWDKVQEAEFFLDKLEETTDEEAYRFYLSAFLSSCWSIFDHLGTEWREYDAFEEWHDEQEERLRSDSFFQFMIRARNCVIHYGRPDTDRSVEVRNPSTTGLSVANQGDQSEFVEVSIDDDEAQTWSVSAGATLSISLPEAKRETPDVEIDAPFYFSGSSVDAPFPDNYAGTPVLYMCEEFLEEMRSLVEVAEDRFEFISNHEQ